MQRTRAPIATDPRAFGRGRARVLEIPREQGWSIPDDVQLFGATFAAGFIFVSILLV